tara:strand:- start:318 stop:467 length:150 start_codon:yes stop_codon:yes gene_type:complete
MTEEQLLKYLNDNPKHKIYVDIDNSGQLIIYTGLQIVDEGFSPIDEEGE